MQPFFTKPDDKGVFLYFKAIAQEVKLPLVLYNCPSRAIINMSVDPMDRITDEVPNFVGLKQTNLDEFPEAVRRKLVQKIGGVDPRNIPVMMAQAEGEPIDCEIGEKIWQQRQWMFDAQ